MIWLAYILAFAGFGAFCRFALAIAAVKLARALVPLAGMMLLTALLSCGH